MDQPTAADALRKLERLIGEWTLSVSAPDGEPWPGSGRTVFAWDPSGAFVTQRTTIDRPDAPDSLCIIGCDAENGTYFQLYSDARGVCRVYEMTIAGPQWTLTRRGDPFPQRFTATISDDGESMTARWERADDGENFAPDFDIAYRKVRKGP